MRERLTSKLFLLALSTTLFGQTALAQTRADVPHQSTPLLEPIEAPSAPLTQIQSTSLPKGLPVKLFYYGPPVNGNHALTITLSKQGDTAPEARPRPLSQTTLHLTELSFETDAIITLPKETSGLQVKAVVRDENQNLVLETSSSVPVLNDDLRLLILTPPPVSTPKQTTDILEFTSVETISGKILLPKNSPSLDGALVHIQLLENALAGGLSMQMVAQDVRPAVAKEGEIIFSLDRGLWERRDDPDLAFKAWITDSRGRKVFVMDRPVSYNGPDIEYVLNLDSLKQGKDTKRGKNLDPSLLAQTLVQGEALFDPVLGIPGQARLKIRLSQDRGDFNSNPTLAEQTLILRGMETRIPFSLVTDSTNFDPYAPAPFLSVALTDNFGRIYYESGEIRAREDQNNIRLYPR